MKNGINKKMLFWLLLLIPLIAITIYITYAFYVGEVEGNEQVSTIAVQGGNILINYQGDSENIVASKIIPGWETTKTFTVSCSINYLDKSSVKIVWYDMILVVDENTFENNSMEYSLQISDADKTKEGIFTEEEYHGISKGASNITMGSGYLLNEATTHTYNLKLRYNDRDDIDQINEKNSKFNARVNVAGSKQTTLTIDFNGGESIRTFALSSGPTYKIAANSRVYIPSSCFNYNSELYDGTSYFEKISGDGNASGSVISTTSDNISVKVHYKPSFSFESWSVIAENVRNNNISKYNVGDEKFIDIDIDGDDEAESYRVRLANKSTYSECRTSGFSQTACGFVVEFVDIIEKRTMNSSTTNKGGWPGSDMYKYLNGDTTDHLTYDGTNATIYSKLPSDLRSVIADTTVVSGHGYADSNTSRTDGNWVSIDKLYLLTTGEIYSNCLTGNCYDTASYPYNGSGATTTRQLDYYNGVTTEANIERAIKQQGGSNTWWWLRGANALDSDTFSYVYTDGYGNNWNSARYSGGVAPAFRIA